MAKHIKSGRGNKAVPYSLNPHKEKIIELYKQGLGTRPIAKEIGNGTVHTAIYKALIRWGIKEDRQNRLQWNKGKRFIPGKKGANSILTAEIEKGLAENDAIKQAIMAQYKDDRKATKAADAAWGIVWKRELNRINGAAWYNANKPKTLERLRNSWPERYAKKKQDKAWKEMKAQSKKKCMKDPWRRFRAGISSRLSGAIKRMTNGSKVASINKLCGCTQLELKAHIEKQFTKQMNWGNYGSYWHCDHIIPITYFDLSKPEEQARCSHFTNLQPLEAKENIRKGNRVGIIQATLGI